jgi:hypothetical protein
LFGHIGDDFFFKRAKKGTLSFNGALNSVCTVLSFPKRLQPITVAVCTVTINVLTPRAFNPESQYFIPLFHDLADNSQEGMKHQMRGATQAQQGMTLQITLLFDMIHMCIQIPNPVEMISE